MRLKTFYIFSLFSIFILSCVSEPTAENITNIDKELNLYLSQLPTPEGPELSFRIESVDLFDCHDTNIESVLSLNEDQITLQIIKIEIPSTCSTGTFPAVGNSSINILEGEFLLEIDLHELNTTKGTLLIYDDYFQMEIEDRTGINALDQRIQLIPDNHVWGTISAPNQMDELQEFLDSSNAFLSISEKVKEENYGLFEVHDLSKIGEINSESELFIFHEITDYDLLKSFVSEFGSKFPTIDIQLTLSTGEEL